MRRMCTVLKTRCCGKSSNVLQQYQTTTMVIGTIYVINSLVFLSRVWNGSGRVLPCINCNPKISLVTKSRKGSSTSDAQIIFYTLRMIRWHIFKYGTALSREEVTSTIYSFLPLLIPVFVVRQSRRQNIRHSTTRQFFDSMRKTKNHHINLAVFCAG